MMAGLSLPIIRFDGYPCKYSEVIKLFDSADRHSINR